MKKPVLLITLCLCSASALYAGWSLGLTGAVKRQVSKLDEKIKQKADEAAASAAQNHAPVISSLQASPVSISTGATTTVTCAASDADGDTLNYSWSAASGTITGAGASVTWTAPAAAGGYTVAVIVSDGKGGSAAYQTAVAVQAIAAPSLTALNPAFSAVYVSSVAASWTAIPGATYVAVLASDSGYGSVVSSGTQTANTAAYAGLSPNAGYYFEVKLSTETNAAYAANRISTATASAPPAMTALNPAFSAVYVSSVAAGWTAVQGATYVVVLASDSGYGSIISSGTLTGNTTAYSGLSPTTSYYFEVKLSTETDAVYSLNRVSTATAAVPPALTALNPAFSAVYVSSFTANWTAVSGATYVAVLASDSGYGSVVSSGALTANTTAYAGLSPGASYYFEVKLSTETNAAYAGNRISTSTLAALVIAQISPYAGLNNAVLKNARLTGANFTAGTAVTLKKSGQADIAATKVTLLGAAQLSFTLPLAGAAAGAWDVVAVNPDASSATLSGGFIASADSSARGWTGVGSTAQSRSLHTSTLLPNGKLLVVGGYNGSPYPSSPEIYAPGSGAWALAGSMSQARYGHTATLLPGGKVLVCGGVYNGSYLASAEIYDTATGLWSSVGSMSHSRQLHNAALLPNGKVLVSGGYDGAAYLSSAEIYDPATRAWTAAASLPEPRVGHTSTLLPNGKVLVCGGMYNGSYLSSTAIYDLAAGAWSNAGSMSQSRQYHSVVLLPGGLVLITGGLNSGGYLSSSELYDSVSGAWTATGSMSQSRGYHAAVLLPNGRVLASGGANGGGSLLSTEIYNPAAGTWTVAASLSKARKSHTAALLPGGEVLAVGGYNSGGYLSSAELYGPATPVTPVFSGVYTSSVAVSWASIAGATYVAVLASNSGYSGIISSGALAGNTTAYSGLSPNTSYYFEVKLSTEADSAYLINRISTATANVPAGLTALNPAFSGVYASSVTASWLPVSGATYTVVLASDSGYAGVISSGTLTANTTSYTGLSLNSTYYFEVKLSTETNAAYGANRISVVTFPNDAGSPGDAGGDFASALAISSGSYTGYLAGSDTDDFYKFPVTAGQRIDISVTPPASADFDLYLYNPGETGKASSTLGTGAADSVSYVADSSGYWYADVSLYDGAGNYSLTVSVTD